MATTNEFNPIATINGADFSVWHFFEEGASLVWDAGNTVQLNDTGRIQECENDITFVMGVGITTASGTEDTLQPLWLFDKNTVFAGTPDTAGDADTIAEIVALIALEAPVDLIVTAGVHELNLNASAVNSFQVVGGDPDQDKAFVIAGFTCQWINNVVGGTATLPAVET